MACCRADVLSMTTVDFMTKEDAIQYCERNGIFVFLLQSFKINSLIKNYCFFLVISKDTLWFVNMMAVVYSVESCLHITVNISYK